MLRLDHCQCAPCRKRKSKCDGALPVCSSCVAVYKTECNYDNAEASSAGRKRTFENDVDEEAAPQPTSEALGVLAASLRALPESEAADLIQKIHGCKDIDALAKSLQAVNLAQPPPDSSSPHASTLTEQPFSLPGGRMAYGKSSGLHFRSRVPHTGRRNLVQTRLYDDSTWSSVTSDGEFVRHLLHLYFSWSHPFHPVGSRDLFYQSFERGDCDHCSPLLVNAILALACHFSDRPQARTNPLDPRTAGNAFWVEAKRLLDDAESAETPSITTPQALSIMSMREISMGRDRSGYGYNRRCMTMVIEMGLHLHLPLHEKAKLTAEELHQRGVTFWGCFTVDLAWALCAGRIPTLPNSTIGVDKSVLRTLPESPTWESYADNNVMINRPDKSLPMADFLEYFSSLSEITSDMLFMYYAPNSHINADKVLDCYNRYQFWYKTLPPKMQVIEEDATLPHVLVLHMTYHNCIYQLFAVLLNIRFTKSDIRPENIGKRAAKAVSDLLKIYRRNYTLRRSALMMTHILVWTCMTHLHGLPDADYAENLDHEMTDLKIMSENHPFALENITIIQEHAEKLDKVLPPRAAQVVSSVLDHSPIPESSRVSGTSSSGNLPHGGMERDVYRPPMAASSMVGSENSAASMDQPYSAPSMVSEAGTEGAQSFAGPYVTHMAHPGPDPLNWAPFHDFDPAQAPVAAPTAGMLGLSDMLAENDYERLHRAGFMRPPQGERYQLLNAGFYAAANDGHRPYLHPEGLHPHYSLRSPGETDKQEMSESGLENVTEGYGGIMRQQWYPRSS